MNFKQYFKGKKITVMGLGLLGRGVGDVRFLAKCGADLIVTDLKSLKDLMPSVKKFSKFNNIKFMLGEHRLEDFRNRDLIIKAAGVPLDSPFIEEARKNNIPVAMSTALFAKFSPANIIGVTGTRGKSTTTQLIYEILKKAGKKVWLGGNVKGVSTLELLPKAKEGDFVVLELDSWQLQGFGEEKISPHVAVFTTFLPDHLNYYKGDMNAYFSDKANIFKYQREEDFLVVGEQVAEKIKKENPKGKIIIARAADVPERWKIKIPGEHNRANIACTVEAARVLGISEKIIKKAVENFKGVPGRLELVRTFKGIKIYNDTTATTPDATIAALRALDLNSSFSPTPLARRLAVSLQELSTLSSSQTRPERVLRGSKYSSLTPQAGGKEKGKNIVLIMGGADKGLDMRKLVEEIPKYCKAVVLLEGTGTQKIFNYQFSNFQSIFNESMGQFSKLEDAVKKAVKIAGKGDIILFSPAFASFGMFKNEYDRGEKFNKIVDKL